MYSPLSIYFKNIKKIGKGSFGNVVRANYTRNEVVALKSFNNDKQTLKGVVNEVLHIN